MKNIKLSLSLSIVSLVCSAEVMQTIQAADLKRDPRAESNGRFFMGGTLGYNISADFTGLGSFPQQTANGAPAGPENRFYDDGFNLIEGRGVPDTLTDKWGYSSTMQVDNANNQIRFHSHSAATVVGHSGVTDGPNPGVELGYAYRFGEFKKASWGLMGGFNFLKVDLTDRKALVGNAVVETDTFDTGGPVVPSAPYNGLTSAFHQRIENVPSSRTSTVLPGGLIAGGRRNIDANIFSLKLGPYVDIPFNERFSLSINGGLVLAGISSKFSYQEVNTISGVGLVTQPGVSATQNFSGSESVSKFLPGAFIGLEGNYWFNEHWSIFAGAQYQYLESLSQNANGRGARLNLGETFLFQLGFGYAF